MLESLIQHGFNVEAKFSYNTQLEAFRMEATIYLEGEVILSVTNAVDADEIMPNAMTVRLQEMLCDAACETLLEHLNPKPI